MKKNILLLASVAALVVTAVAQPAYMNYQGRLLNSEGKPLTNETCTLVFNIYDSPTGGNLIWGPQTNLAVVANGRFNVILGGADYPITNAFLADERFVEIKVNGGAPILPRQQILSAPYAFRAGTAASADQLNHLPPADYFLPPGMIVPFAGPNIPTGWLLCDGSAVASTNRSRLFAAIGTAWGNGTYHQGSPESPANPGTDFNVPDLRGMFLRGVNGGRTGSYADPDTTGRVSPPAGGYSGNNVGSHQSGRAPDHKHQWANTIGGSVRDQDLVSYDSSGNNVTVINWYNAGGYGSGSEYDDTITLPTASTDLYTKLGSAQVGESRPNNAYVNYIIKY